jgi:hypothetical protein
MDMKRIGFLLLLWMASVATATAQSFPSGKKFYFGREDGRLMTVSLMYDNKGDAVASVMLGYASHLFLCTGTSDEWFSFEGYTLAPEYRAQSVGMGGFPVMMPTGDVCKSKNSERFYLARDCSQAVYNDTWYTIRLSPGRFNELYEQNYGSSPAEAPTAEARAATAPMTPTTAAPRAIRRATATPPARRAAVRGCARPATATGTSWVATGMSIPASPATGPDSAASATVRSESGTDC